MSKGKNVLFDAIAFESSAEVESLLKDGVDVNAKDEDGWVPLHLAVRLGNAAIGQLLLEKDAEVNAKDDYGWTPLHWAVRLNNAEMTRLLLEKDANVNAKNNDGLTPLDLANTEGVLALLKEHGGKEGQDV